MAGIRIVLVPVLAWVNHNTGVNITATDFPHANQQFLDFGLPFNDFVNKLNAYITLGVQQNDSTIAPTGFLSAEMSLMWQVLDVSEFLWRFSNCSMLA